MAQLEFYHDEHGNPCARGGDERLARFLETDLQGATELVDELLARLAQTHETSEFAGNAHSVTITLRTATIECNFDDGPDRRIDRRDLVRVLTAWRRFIS